MLRRSREMKDLFIHFFWQIDKSWQVIMCLEDSGSAFSFKTYIQS